jgi:hypothetical protein
MDTRPDPKRVVACRPKTAALGILCSAHIWRAAAGALLAAGSHCFGQGIIDFENFSNSEISTNSVHNNNAKWRNICLHNY